MKKTTLILLLTLSLNVFYPSLARACDYAFIGEANEYFGGLVIDLKAGTATYLDTEDYYEYVYTEGVATCDPDRLLIHNYLLLGALLVIILIGAFIIITFLRERKSEKKL